MGFRLVQPNPFERIHALQDALGGPPEVADKAMHEMKPLLEEAVPLLQRAHERTPSPDNTFSLASMLQILATVHGYLGDHEQSASQNQRAIDLLEPLLPAEGEPSPELRKALVDAYLHQIREKLTYIADAGELALASPSLELPPGDRTTEVFLPTSVEQVESVQDLLDRASRLAGQDAQLRQEVDRQDEMISSTLQRVYTGGWLAPLFGVLAGVACFLWIPSWWGLLPGCYFFVGVFFFWLGARAARYELFSFFLSSEDSQRHLAMQLGMGLVWSPKSILLGGPVFTLLLPLLGLIILSSSTEDTLRRHAILVRHQKRREARA